MRNEEKSMINKQNLGTVILIGTIAVIAGIVFVTWDKEQFREPTEEIRVAPQQPDQVEHPKAPLSCTSIYVPPALRQDIDVIDYLDGNMLSMVRTQPVSGAEKLSVDSVLFFPNNKIFATARLFDESRNGGGGAYRGAFFENIYFFGQYSLKNNGVRVDYIDEATEKGTIHQFFEDRKLLVKHGLVDRNTPVSPDREYSRPRQADCPWILSTFNAFPPDLDPFEITNPAASITITAIGDDNASRTNRKFVYVDLTCSEPRGIKDVRYTDEEGFTTEPFRPFLSRIKWDLKKEGINAITYQCRDNGGDITTVSGSIVHDTTPPKIVDAKPAGALPAGTTSTTISFITDEPATCGYSVLSDIYSEPRFSNKTSKEFPITGGTFHQTTITELPVDEIISYFIKCMDVVGNQNARFDIGFWVEPSRPYPRPEETSVTLSPGRTWATIRSPLGRQFIHVDQVETILRKELGPAPNARLFTGIASVSPDGDTIALGITGSGLADFIAFYRISTESFSYLGRGTPTS